MEHYVIPTIETKRRSAPAGLAGYLIDEPAVRDDIALVANDLHVDLMPATLATLASHDALYEPKATDLAALLAAQYTGSRDGQRIMAIMLRAAAIGHLTAAPFTDRWMNAEFIMMNVGDHTPRPGEEVGDVRHRSEASKERCRIGCAAIVARRAGRCLNCGGGRDARPGRRSLRDNPNHYCDRACEDGESTGRNRRYRQDAAAFIFEQMAFLLDQVETNVLLRGISSAA